MNRKKPEMAFSFFCGFWKNAGNKNGERGCSYEKNHRRA